MKFFTIVAQTKYYQPEQGQTLIETLVAIFMLVMGITAAVGLAVYAFNSSSNITKQIIATGLAREGVEAIKNMRDTNWLKSTLSDPVANPPGCYNFVSGNNDADCYKTWLNPPGAPGPGLGYNITGGRSLRLNITASGDDLWVTAADTANWGLDFDPNLTCGANFCGFYGSSNINSGSADGTSDYYRQIVITEDATAPFDHGEYHRLEIESRVWWTDQKCPRVQSWSQTSPTCRVAIDTNLTNWKDY